MEAVRHLKAGARDAAQVPEEAEARMVVAKELAVEKARKAKVKAAEGSSSITSGRMQATILGTTGNHDLIVAMGNLSTSMQSQ